MCSLWECLEQVELRKYFYALERVSADKLLFVADEKLQWLFKLYDKDQNGEIVQDEMEDIFIKMCRIVEKTEVDHMKKHAKIAEEERKRQAQGKSGNGIIYIFKYDFIGFFNLEISNVLKSRRFFSS